MRTSRIILTLLLVAQYTFAQRGYAHLVGQPAPAIEFQTTLGEPVKPGFYKNKTLVLDFWATWCAPCIAAFPHFNKLSERFAGKDVVFASLTDEPYETVANFFKRTGKQLLPYKLIDSAKLTTQKLGITAIPVTLVIGKDNRIQWAGLTSELNETVLNGILSGASAASTQATGAKNKLVNRPIAQRSLFSFSAAYSDTAKANYEDIGLVYQVKDRIILYSEGNIPLGKLLERLTGYSRAARFSTNDSGKLNRLIDVFFKADRDSLLFQNYDDLVLQNEPRKNLMLLLLQETFRFKLTVKKRKLPVYQIDIADPQKFKIFHSTQNERKSFSSDFLPKVEAVGYSLKEVATELETLLKVPIESLVADKQRMDLSLDISNIETLRKALAFHGLDLRQTEKLIEVLNIQFY